MSALWDKQQVGSLYIMYIGIIVAASREEDRKSQDGYELADFELLNCCYVLLGDADYICREAVAKHWEDKRPHVLQIVIFWQW